jgi:S-adenosylmethionine:tRNA ribosyltransferase-isomerase
MRKPSTIQIADFDYTLPEERIAKYPLSERDSSKLLCYKKGTIESKTFRDLPEILRAGDRLVFNVTKVVKARLDFYKTTGARIEIFLLHPSEPSDYAMAFSSCESVVFSCLIGNAKKWKEGYVYAQGNNVKVEAEKLAATGEDFQVRFQWNNPDFSFTEVLEDIGSIPIPPYLNRDTESSDEDNYQTVYARSDGSVAAPTAGLHFTDQVFHRLSEKGISRDELILHVGAGTFVPVKIDNAIDHRMHSEKVTINRKLIERLLMDRRTIAVGTTSTRSLESLYWLGVKLLEDKSAKLENLIMEQWEAYEMDQNIPLRVSLESILKRMESEHMEDLTFQTHIMITPGYDFKVIDGLITNFHQPKSILLLLIAAVVGEDWKRIYKHAMENGYRFLSYGDSSLLLK